MSTTHHLDEPSSTTAIISGVVAVVIAFVAGLWKFISGQKKTGSDAQNAMVVGFVALLAEFRRERELLIERIAVLESENQWAKRRIGKLERVLHKHGIVLEADND